MDLTTEFWIQMIIYALSLGVAFGTIQVRLKYLEKKMDKHNNLVERMTAVEQSAKQAHKRIDEHKDDVEKDFDSLLNRSFIRKERVR